MTVLQQPVSTQSKPWCEIAGYSVWRFSHRPNELPTRVIRRVVTSGRYDYCPNHVVDAIIELKRSSNAGYIITPISPGVRRILQVLGDRRIIEVSESAFDFYAMNWSIAVVAR